MTDIAEARPHGSWSPMLRQIGLRIRTFGEQIAVLLIGVVLWEAAVRYFEVPPYFIPSPIAVAVQFWYGLTSGLFLEHAVYTVSATLMGFALGGVVGVTLGVLVSQFSIVNRLIYPFVVAFQTVPKVALAPIIVVWFGFGISSKVVIAMLICFFPIVVNTIEGFNAVRPEQIMLLRSYKASRWDIFRMVQLPNALPSIFAGLDIGIVLAVIGTIVGEFVGTTHGLGRVLYDFNQGFKISGVFATVLVLAIIGVSLHAILKAIRRRVVFWQGSERSLSV